MCALRLWRLLRSPLRAEQHAPNPRYSRPTTRHPPKSWFLRGVVRGACSWRRSRTYPRWLPSIRAASRCCRGIPWAGDGGCALLREVGGTRLPSAPGSILGLASTVGLATRSGGHICLRARRICLCTDARFGCLLDSSINSSIPGYDAYSLEERINSCATSCRNTYW